MVSIIFIFSGFIILILAEWRYIRLLRRNPEKNETEYYLPPSRGHAALQSLGYSLVAFGVFWALIGNKQNMHWPGTLHTICLWLALAGGCLLVWTVFLEIPLGAKRYKVPAGHVYARGNYGRCRHPGFWFFLVFSFGLAFWSNNSLILFSFFIANVLNLLLILLQDQYTFPMQFVDYREYARKVPFLVPHFRRRHR